MINKHFVSEVFYDFYRISKSLDITIWPSKCTPHTTFICFVFMNYPHKSQTGRCFFRLPSTLTSVKSVFIELAIETHLFRFSYKTHSIKWISIVRMERFYTVLSQLTIITYQQISNVILKAEVRKCV